MLLISTTGWGALIGYSQDFEAFPVPADPPPDPPDLLGDGYKIFGNVFNSGGGFLFGYGVFDAPNGGPGFSSIETGEGGVPQGDRYLNIYSDYNCCQPSSGHFGTDRVESNVFQEQIIGAGDVGSLWSFSFDAKQPSSMGCSDTTGNGAAISCQAFIKTLDPNAGFAQTNFITFDSSTLSNSAWSSHAINIAIDGSLANQILQFGFTSTSSSFQNTGVYYDNINFQVVPVPAAVWLFGSALGLLGFVRRRLTKSA